MATTDLVKALAVMVTDRVHRAWMQANDPKALEQAEHALKGAGFVVPASVYEDVLSADEVAALRECVGMEKMCSTPDTALPVRVGEPLRSRGFVIEVTDSGHDGPHVRWYVITGRGRAALTANL